MLIALLFASALPPAPVGPDTTVRLSRGATVSIETYAGAIAIHAGSDDMLRIKGARVRLRDNNVRIEGDAPGRLGGGDLDITLPSWARIEVSSYTGAVSIAGGFTRVHAETVNGEIQVRDGAGTIGLESVTGEITVTGFRGDRLDVDATGGGVTVSGATGRLAIESVNGAVHLRDMQALSVEASSVNDVVDYSGTLSPQGTYEFSSHNGGITLALPATVSARMEVNTFNGEFRSSEIAGTTNGTGAAGNAGHAEQSFTVTYGKGEARVSLDSYNGNITVRRLRSN